jgi:uncharacterized membrane protein YdjX (TVP38/TMEM64 family)
MISGTKIKIFAILTVAALLVVGFKVGGFDTLSLEYIAAHSAELEKSLEENLYRGIATYVLFYVLFLSIGAPIGAIMSVVAGYFFGLYIGLFAVMLSAMVSAGVTFFVGKKLLNRYLRRKYHKNLKRIEQELEQNGLYYVLATRFSSVLPFFLLNLLFGASGISGKKYFLGTFVGLIPGTIIYLNIGSSLKEIEAFGGIFSLELLMLFLALAVLAISPVLIKHLNKERQTAKRRRRDV